MWLRDASVNAWGYTNGLEAFDNIDDLNARKVTPSGYTAQYSDWRMPTRGEMMSLIDPEYYQPAVPNTLGTGQHTEGNPFISLINNSYWTSTTYYNAELEFMGIIDTTDAWGVDIAQGSMTLRDKVSDYQYVLPVRTP